jgi:hypothetical protein
MNKFAIIILKVLRKMYSKVFGVSDAELPECEQDPDVVSERIYSRLMADKPCMIARFGSTELTCLANYLGVKKNKKNYLEYIKGNAQSWWWEPAILNQMQQWSGFFPPTHAKIKQFCELMLKDILQVDILGSWLVSEYLFKKELRMKPKVRLGLLDPYWSNKPWTKALEGKTVLVLHPFAETIEKQYQNRALLFNNNLLPKFELKTIKAVQTIAGTKSDFKDWFEALNFMKSEIDKTDYDICLIGAGAYGFPLAAHVKRTGKKAVHMGGSLQLLFGIRGKRWESTDYHEIYDYASLVNKYWVKPSRFETPNKSSNVEDGCYW